MRLIHRDSGNGWGWRYRNVWRSQFNWRRFWNYRLRWQNDKPQWPPKPGFRGWTLYRKRLCERCLWSGHNERHVTWEPIAMWGWEYWCEAWANNTSKGGDCGQVLWDRDLA